MTPATRLATVILLALAVVSAAGCSAAPAGSPQLNTPALPPPIATPTSAPATAAPVARGTATAATAGSLASAADLRLVQAALANQASAESFGMMITTEGRSNLVPFPGVIVMEISQKPQRAIYMKLGDLVQIIVMDQDAYVRLGQAWQRMPVPQEQLQQLESGLDLANLLTAQDLAEATITRVGTEQVDGVETDVFDVVPSKNFGQAAPSLAGLAFRVWIDRTTEQVAQEVLKETDAAVTIKYYGWDAIRVEPR